jgi:hypothetical protein
MLYILTVLYMHTVLPEATMEHLVRVYNEKDRRTLEWLRRHVGDAAIADAAGQCASSGKPFLSAVCRHLGVKVPAFRATHGGTAPTPVGEASLANIRTILAARTRPVAASRLRV